MTICWNTLNNYIEHFTQLGGGDDEEKKESDKSDKVWNWISTQR